MTLAAVELSCQNKSYGVDKKINSKINKYIADDMMIKLNNFLSALNQKLNKNNIKQIKNFSFNKRK